MRDDVKLKKWSLSADGQWTDDFLESVFFTGNGRMGARGYCVLEKNPLKTGLFLAGVFGELKPGLTDFVNLPTPLYARLSLNGQSVEPCSIQSDSVSRTLDLRTGVFSADYTLDGVAVREERFFSLANTGLLVQRLTLTPAVDGKLELSAGVHTACCNCPVPDDQTKENTEMLSLTQVESVQSEDSVVVKLRTVGAGIELTEDLSFHSQGLRKTGTFQDSDGAGLIFSVDGKSGNDYVLEQRTLITTSRDRDCRIAPPEEEWSYQSLLAESEAAWQAKWEIANIEIDGDEEADSALRYVCFQLMANAAPDPTVSIGARGLTHTRYKGCYFWDTDLFMMPFYLHTDPPTARNLMQYRINCLPQAKAHGAKMNGAGARYPWMTAFDGSEQCESWDIGASEVHVTADVAFALKEYFDKTGDETLYANGGAEVFVETARFWQSRYTAEPDSGKVNLLFCKGPDEYCGITSNNYYTNLLVKENLSLAQEAALFLKKNQPKDYARLGLTDDEVTAWERLSQAIKLPRDPQTNRLRQDDTFHLLEPVDISALKDGDTASYRQVCFDRVQRYQVVKQADLLLLMTRLPDRFTEKEKAEAWQDFEPKCLHDSTLSFASHALFAAQNGIEEKAWDYFRKALLLDLRNVMDNTGGEGLHLACFGESWQAAVGFGGLRFENGTPRCQPHLPKSWKRMRFQFWYRGKRYEAQVSQDHAVIIEKTC